VRESYVVSLLHCLMIIAQSQLSLSLSALSLNLDLKHPTSLKLKPIENSHHHSWTEAFFCLGGYIHVCLINFCLCFFFHQQTYIHQKFHDMGRWVTHYKHTDTHHIYILHREREREGERERHTHTHTTSHHHRCVFCFSLLLQVDGFF
jgi:hypothetical protein